MSVLTFPAPTPPAPAGPPAEAPSGAHPASAPGVLQRYFSCLFDLTATPAPWDRATYGALAGLFLLWAVRVYTTWATWGYLSVDSGREMYVPAMLAQGKMLYRDVWYGYAPLAPYWNAFLFHLFGVHLNVLYWAGSLAALSCALLLFFTGKRLSSSLAGWTAGAVMLLEAFHAWHFSFPLAYSFSAVYGCLAACVFLWCAIHACGSANWGWMFAAATVAAVALLIKLEFGAACYVIFCFLVAARGWRQRSWKRAVIDFAATLPGLAACAFVALWMLSIAGWTFITQENLASTWPGSFFMRTYGRAWMETTGLAITGPALLQSLLRTLFLAGVILEGYLLFWRKRFSFRSTLLCAVLFAALLAYVVFALGGDVLETAAAVFFPRDMVLYVAVAAVLVCWRIARNDHFSPALPIAVLFAFAALVAIRTLLRTIATGYSIYYSGAAVLAFLILLRPLVPRAGRSAQSVFRAELLLCVASLAVVSVYAARFAADYNDRELLVTERGSIMASTQTTEQYRAAIQLMKQESAAGRMVLSVPEDTSLYFLSGTQAPSRLYFFAPGMLVPGKMTDTIIREIERKPVRYVLWSNRRFPEYGVPEFGVDSDRTFANYLTSHYREVGPLVPGTAVDWHVRFTVWERKPDFQPR